MSALTPPEDLQGNYLKRYTGSGVVPRKGDAP